MSYAVLIPKPVQKQLNDLPEDVSSRILEKILSLAEELRPPGVKKLKGFETSIESELVITESVMKSMTKH